MAYEPAVPTIVRRPERIAEETWLSHQVQKHSVRRCART
jgi:hypothetical protein